MAKPMHPTHPRKISPNEISAAVWTVAEAQAIDRMSIKNYSVDADRLMETAGKKVTEHCVKILKRRKGRPRQVLVLCGPGNNGGDGLVVARLLKKMKYKVYVFFCFTKKTKTTEGFETNLKRATSAKVPCEAFRRGCFDSWTDTPTLIVDGVFGLGFRPPLKDEALGALKAVASLNDKVTVAIDIPSGLHGDHVGSVALDQVPLQANLTVTFGAAKPIHVLAQGRDICGALRGRSLPFATEAVTAILGKRRVPDLRRTIPRLVLKWSPWDDLPQSANKYDRGHVLVVGGSDGKVGAPIMAALAALRSGCGWASVAVPRSAQESFPAPAMPVELTAENIFKGASPAIDADKLTRFLVDRRVRCVVFGPGWMTQHLDHVILESLLEVQKQSKCSIVFDAAATARLILLHNGLSGKLRGAVATPHPGEWRKCVEASDPQEPISLADLTAMENLAVRSGLGLLYKGSSPVWFDGSPHFPKLVCNTGSKILARAGSGDVLAGCIAAQLAVGCEPWFAVARAQVLIGRAAKDAAKLAGPDGVLASDILTRLALRR